MACERDRLLLHAYADGELDLVRSLEIEEHVKTCPDCAQELRRQATLQKAFRSPGLYQRAPESLRARILATAGRDSAASTPSDSASRVATMRPLSGRRAFEWLAVAAAIVIVFFVGLRVVPSLQNRSRGDLSAQEMVASHIRSLQPGHLYDVESTDQHTVKPWFDGKLDFSPPVRDFASQGFPLVGGRLDYIGSRAVAALVYQRRKHVISVYVWPSNDREMELPSGSTKQQSRNGYNLLEWRQGDMHVAAVSDVNPDDLKQFMQLFQQ